MLFDPSRNDSSGHQKENKTGAQFDVPGDINFTLLDLIKEIGTESVFLSYCYEMTDGIKILV